MKLKKRHKILDKILKRNIKREIKQILEKEQAYQSDDSDDNSEWSSCHNSKYWKYEMKKIIFSKKAINGMRRNSKSKDEKLVHKKSKKHNKEGRSIVVEPIVCKQGSITKTRQIDEVRGSPQAPWQLYYDGASVKSRKYAGSGAVLQNIKHHTLDEFAQYIGPQTMHVAEYVGLLGGLRLALNWNVDHLCCYGDSRTIHNQVKGLWKTRNSKMAFLCFHAQKMVKLFKSVKFVLIRRKKNLHAARLAHEAINIHWDREALAKSQCEENKPKKKNDESKNEDDDQIDFDEYYEYHSIES